MLDTTLNPLLPLLLFFFLAAGASDAASAAAPPPSPSSNGTTVYELLPKFGLPSGLLPNTVTSFSLASNGEFEVNLAGDCYVNFEYLVYYAPKITGVIRYGEIDDLKGIQVRRFFIWFDVDSIKVDLPPSNYIYFDVGLITKKLSVGQFKNIHSCQKGLSADLMEHGVGFDRVFFTGEIITCSHRTPFGGESGCATLPFLLCTAAMYRMTWRILIHLRIVQ